MKPIKIRKPRGKKVYNPNKVVTITKKGIRL